VINSPMKFHLLKELLCKKTLWYYIKCEFYATY